MNQEDINDLLNKCRKDRELNYIHWDRDGYDESRFEGIQKAKLAKAKGE